MSDSNYPTRALAKFIFLFIVFPSIAQDNLSENENLFLLPRNYLVYQAISEISIDGKPDEISWKKAEWTKYFQDIEGDKKPSPTYNTRVKMLWDEQNLYFLAELEEPHVWAYYNKHDQIVYHENDFEIFIDPNRNTHDYFEFEINAQNTLFDLYMPKPYRNGGKPNIDWNANGFKSAVFVDGTLNDPSDTDKKWTIEIAIPFASLPNGSKEDIPQNGHFWKINFSRVQWQTEFKDKKYQKLKDPISNRFINENNWVWSQQGVINMHFPERWGLILFSNNKVGTEKIIFQFPKEELLARYLWQLYYRQHNFKRQNGNYALVLSELNLKNTITTETGEIVRIRLDTNPNGFSAFLEDGKNLTLSINQDGLFELIIKKIENE